MAAVTPTGLLSQWNQMVPGMQQFPDDVYRRDEAHLVDREFKSPNLEPLDIVERRFFSTRRDHVRVPRGQRVFHVRAAPFRSCSLISWRRELKSAH